MYELEAAQLANCAELFNLIYAAGRKTETKQNKNITVTPLHLCSLNLSYVIRHDF